MKKSEPDAILGVYSKTVGLDISIKCTYWTSLDFNTNQYCQKVIETVIQHVLGNKCKFVEVSLLLADDKTLRGLNKEYRNKDKPTNVLSFPFFKLGLDDIIGAVKSSPQLFLGDIAISYERVESESLQQMKMFVEHFTHILIHGTLHLFGYNHIEDDEAEIMEALEIKIMRTLGFEYSPIIFEDYNKDTIYSEKNGNVKLS
jgi:probable rRNA maturation factor